MDLAMSSDGAIMVVSAPTEYVGSNTNVGSVYVYAKDNLNGNWVFKQRIRPATASNSNNGTKISLDSTGKYLLITSNSAPTYNVHLYVKQTTGEFIYVNSLSFNESPFIKVNNAGIIYIGLPNDSTNSAQNGLVKRYTIYETGTNYSIGYGTTIPCPVNRPYARFGAAIDVPGGDQNAVFISAPGINLETDNSTFSGGVYRFFDTGTGPTVTHTVRLPDASPYYYNLGENIVVS